MYLPIIFAGFSDCNILPFHIAFGLVIISLSLLPMYIKKGINRQIGLSTHHRIVSITFAAVFAAIAHIAQLIVVPQIGDEFNKFYFAKSIYLIVILLTAAGSFGVALYLTKRHPRKLNQIAQILLNATIHVLILVGIGVMVAKTLECIV